MKTKYTYLLFLLTISFAVSAQQPTNASFDVWTSSLHPDGWTSVENLIGSPVNVFTFQDTVDKVDGHSSLKLVADSVPGFPQYGVVGSMVGLGPGSLGPNGPAYVGLAFTGRPDTLIFDYKHASPNGPDTGYVNIGLTLNQGAVLSYTIRVLDQSSWTHVAVPITGYYSNGLTPDTLQMQIGCSTGSNGSSHMGSNMHIDHLRFGYATHTGSGPEAYTMGHDPLGSHNFNLYGAVNTNGDTATYAFVYSTDSTFSTAITTPAQGVRNGSLHVVWATVNALAANTTYFYYITANTVGGTTNGVHMKFYSDTISYLLENTGADVYGTSYAELNGKINGFHSPDSLCFEYGLTPDMGLQTTSNYNYASDSNSHTFRGTPNPLTPGSLYFYRVKAFSATDSAYSDIRGFYMGTPYTTVQALPATNVTATSADLNGIVQGFSVPIKINSEINGGVINHLHTALEYYDVTASVINYVYHASNLPSNQYFSVRFKVASWLGNYYGDTAFSTIAVGILPVGGQFDNISIYPNPVSNQLTAELNSESNSESTIQLFNLSGQKIKEIKVAAGQSKVSINIADMENGLYLLHYLTDRESFNTRIVVAK